MSRPLVQLIQGYRNAAISKLENRVIPDHYRCRNDEAGGHISSGQIQLRALGQQDRFRRFPAVRFFSFFFCSE